jgi:hypothetical protein
MSTRGVHWEWESKIELRFVFSFIQPPQGIVVLAVTRSSCCLGLRRPCGVRGGNRRRHLI